MKRGDLIRFKSPLSPAEADERYRLVDEVGAYGSVKCIDATGQFTGWIVEPVFTFRFEELEVIE